jgi:hypothetical protein
VPVAQRIHLCRAPRLTAGFHDSGNLVVHLKE